MIAPLHPRVGRGGVVEASTASTAGRHARWRPISSSSPAKSRGLPIVVPSSENWPK